MVARIAQIMQASRAIVLSAKLECLLIVEVLKAPNLAKIFDQTTLSIAVVFDHIEAAPDLSA